MGLAPISQKCWVSELPHTSVLYHRWAQFHGTGKNDHTGVYHLLLNEGTRLIVLRWNQNITCGLIFKNTWACVWQSSLLLRSEKVADPSAWLSDGQKMSAGPVWAALDTVSLTGGALISSNFCNSGSRMSCCGRLRKNVNSKKQDIWRPESLGSDGDLMINKSKHSVTSVVQQFG